MKLRRVSTVDALAAALRERLLDGDLEPGARLREVELAESYDVARHTVRAALQALVHEGLLRREPNRGAFVPEVTGEDVVDLFRLRAAIEGEAVRALLEGGGALDGAEAAVRELEALGDDAPWRAVVEPDLRFHAALVAAAGSPRLARAFAALEGEIRLCLVQLRPHYDRPSQVAAEHRELLGALERGDAATAEVTLRTHLQLAVGMLA